MKNEINKQIFLNNLPRYIKGESNVKEGRINWGKSIGHTVKFIYDNIEDYLTIIDYKDRYLYINYKDKKNFKIYTGNFLKCNFGKLLNKITLDFKLEIGAKIKDKNRDLIIIGKGYIKDDKNRNYKNYKYHCNVCSFDGEIIEANLLFHKKGCSCCSNRTTVLGVNSIYDTDPWMIPYIGEECAKTHTKCSEYKINPICPECGKNKDKPIRIVDIYNHHSIGCECSDKYSYPNKISYELLNQLNYMYQFKYLEYEYSPKWCKYLFKNKLRQGRYDNYFEYNKNKFIIEMDGDFHYKDNNMGKQTSKESKYIDNEKDRLAKEHNIEVIRIDCRESDLDYIKNNILNSKLAEIFDLNKINWLKCEEFALSNLVKKACEYKKDNPDMTTVEIGKLMNIKRSTITRYLKKGTKLGWCNYNSEEEIIKNNNKKAKAVKVFKDEKLIGVFDSIGELVRQSEVLFKVKFYDTNIISVCKGRTKTYKGFTFKYVDKYNINNTELKVS